MENHMEGILNLIWYETYFVAHNRGGKYHIRPQVSIFNHLRNRLQQLLSKYGGSRANLKGNKCS